MSNNPRIGLYKEAMSLEEQRGRLQAELDRVNSRLNAVQSQLFDVESSAISAPAVSAAPAVSSGGRRSRGRSRRGELKARVLQALVAAGSSGLRVKDLAASLGTKPANIYAWFQTAPKRIPQIKKIGEAHYRLEGSLAQKHLAGPVAKAPKAPGKLPIMPRRSSSGFNKKSIKTSLILFIPPIIPPSLNAFFMLSQWLYKSIIISISQPIGPNIISTLCPQSSNFIIHATIKAINAEIPKIIS